MYFSRLSVDGLRILQDVDVAPGGRVNIVVGENGSGKTSLLEAIHLLAYGRSFRTRRWEDLVGRGREGFLVFGEARDEGEVRQRVGAEMRRGGRRIRLDGRDVASSLELEGLPRVLVYGPGSERLIAGGPEERRGALDWLVFHVEHRHGERIREYQRNLAQRNAALRDGTDREVEVWSHRLGEVGRRVDAARRRVLEAFAPIFQGHAQGLLGRAVATRYRPGWQADSDLEQALLEGAAADRERGWTGIGPHRADVVVRGGSQDLRIEGSRGEQKLVAAAWFVASLDFVRTGGGEVALVDDLAAELDHSSRGRVLEALGRWQGQLFLTALEEGLFRDDGLAIERVFHVEQGTVHRVV